MIDMESSIILMPITDIHHLGRGGHIGQQLAGKAGKTPRCSKRGWWIECFCYVESRCGAVTTGEISLFPPVSL